MNSKVLAIVLRAAVLVSLMSVVLQPSTVNAAPKAKEIAFWNDSEEQSALDLDHSRYDRFLKKYVRAGHPSGINRFDYESVTEADRQELEEYLNYAQQMDPRQFSKARQKAYWLNLYNATLIREVLNKGAENSVKELGRGLWRANRLYITMQKVSLDDIEHGILRPIFKDPRVHFSLVAGTIGSASILPQAFTAENVESLLDQNTKEFLNHSRGVSFDNDKLVLSSIFKWYKNDFGGNLDTVKRFLIQYLDSSSASRVVRAGSVRYDYEWALNKP